MNGPTTIHDRSLWPPAAALLESVVVLAGLVLIVLLADGQLVLWLSAALIIAWAVLNVRRAPENAPEPPMWARLVPLFAAIILAQLVAPNEWSIVALFAIAGLLFGLTRAGRILHERGTA